jgi:hypothetical protein
LNQPLRGESGSLAPSCGPPTMTDIYSKIHTARFGKVREDIAPLEFVRPLSELCLRSAALHFRHRPTFAGVPEKFKVCSVYYSVYV